MKPLEFKEWLLAGMNYQNKKLGTTFETVCPGLMREPIPKLKTTYQNLQFGLINRASDHEIISGAFFDVGIKLVLG